MIFDSISAISRPADRLDGAIDGIISRLRTVLRPIPKHRAHLCCGSQQCSSHHVQVGHRVTTNSNHTHPIFPNRLERDFSPSGADQVYAGDITYVWTQEGWLYLAVVIDLYSRKVVGWSMSKRLVSQLVCDALQMALWNRRPVKGRLMHHSDRGVQYASNAFRNLLKQHGITGSMSRKGHCWDNAVVESFLKCERVLWRSYQTRNEVRADIVEYITMFYNSQRLHSYLEYQSPDQFERNGQLADTA